METYPEAEQWTVTIDALIFDFDGVILDTETPDFQTWDAVFRDHGARLERPVWNALIGRGRGVAFDMCGHLEELSGRRIDCEAVNIERRRRYLDRIESSALLPGVMDYILGARKSGLKLGVASSSSRDWVEGHLRSRDILGYFDCVRCGDDVAKTKPDPELYLSALEQMDTRADEAFAIEDSPVGIAAARAAGLFCVAVPNPMTRDLPLGEADLVLDSLADRSLGAVMKMAVGKRP